MSVYAAITGGMFSFMAYIGLQTSWLPLFIIGLTFDIALEIPKILGEVKRQIGKIPDYPRHESIGWILERF